MARKRTSYYRFFGELKLLLKSGIPAFFNEYILKTSLTYVAKAATGGHSAVQQYPHEFSSLISHIKTLTVY